MNDDRWQTAWGIDNPASRDGARLLIKRINNLADNQNRFQVGMKDSGKRQYPSRLCNRSPRCLKISPRDLLSHTLRLTKIWRSWATTCSIGW